MECYDKPCVCSIAFALREPSLSSCSLQKTLILLLGFKVTTAINMSSTQTLTQTYLNIKASGHHGFPNKLDEKYSDSAKLSREQCGHIRHFHNLASQLDGEWSLMGTQEPGQEWDTAYRYQIASMTYATGAAYYHRLPAMRSILKPLMRKLIGKMLRREVWGYWYLTSQSGIRIDPDLKELRKPWANPVCKENVMVSFSSSQYYKVRCG